jgi:hypothetical protein
MKPVADYEQTPENANHPLHSFCRRFQEHANSYSMAMKPIRAAAAAPPAMVMEVAPLEPVVCAEEEPEPEAVACATL